MTVYLDHAATSPLRAEVAAALAEQFALVGNPSSLHAPGRAARQVLEESREQIAAALGAAPLEVVLTAGGTEADNLAVKGLFWARRAEDARRRRILVSAVEHHAVLDPAQWLAHHQGAELVLLDVDGRGRLELARLRHELEREPESVALVSVMTANNEVGTVQPVPEVVALAAAHGVPVHADAVQAVGQIPVDFAASGLAALTLSGHKLGGPLGAGALLVRRDVALEPVLHGGGQERGVRSGTPDAAAARGLAVAVSLAVAGLAAQAPQLEALRDRLVTGVLGLGLGAELRGAELQGGDPGDVDLRRAAPAPAGTRPAPARLPGNALLTFPGCESDALLYLLDEAGIACSAGSACQAGVARPSHVLLAMGLDEATARSALRFSLGHTSTEADVAAVVVALPEVVARARVAAAAS